MSRTTINDLLGAARARLQRLEPEAAREATEHGAVLIDVRSDRQRVRDGVIPGARHFARNVLEWRLDPESGATDAELGGDLDRHLIVVCDEGYQSSLAAATLQELGLPGATDLAGGFQAWRDAGLPVDRP